MSLESSVSFWDALSFWLITAGAISASLGGLSSIMSRRYNRQLVALTQEQNRQAKEETDKAIADAGARAAEANARAAAANLKAGQERSERLAIERELHIRSGRIIQR